MVANATGIEPTWQGEDSEGRRERHVKDNCGLCRTTAGPLDAASVWGCFPKGPQWRIRSLFHSPEVGTWHARGWHTLPFNPHLRIPIALSSCRDVRALLWATCAGPVCVLPLGLIAPAPLCKPLVHDDFNPKCIFEPSYAFPLSRPLHFSTHFWGKL